MDSRLRKYPGNVTPIFSFAYHLGASKMTLWLSFIG